MAMVKHTIYFQDLARQSQDVLWTKVRDELLARGEIEKEDYETEAEFETRLWETVDYYINTNNFANEFYL